MSVFFGLLLLILAGIAVMMRGDIIVGGLDGEEFAAIASGLGLAFLILPYMFSSYRGRLRAAFRDVMSWSLIGLALIAGYSYRYEIGEVAYRIAGELAPPGNTVSVEQGQNGANAVRIRKRSDGHFIANVGINGASVPMLVDTGASTVVLRQDDAKRLGVDLTRLSFTVPVQTANGLAYAAQVRLNQIAVGNITVSNIDALVAQRGALKESLLGMTFLSRLRSYEFSGDFLTFRN